MKNTKKLLILLTVLAMCLSLCAGLAGCGEDSNNEGTVVSGTAVDHMVSIKSAGGMAVVIATKADKLSKKALEENLEMIIETLDLQDGDILFPFSTQNTDGVEIFWDYIYDYILYDDEEEGEE